MLSSIPPTETVQEFGTAKGWRWFIYLLMPPLILLFIAMPSIFWDAKAPLGLMLSISLLFIGMAGFFLYGLIETVKGKHIITNLFRVFRLGVFYGVARR